jgi:hypothetical protein
MPPGGPIRRFGRDERRVYAGLMALIARLFEEKTGAPRPGRRSQKLLCECRNLRFGGSLVWYPYRESARLAGWLKRRRLKSRS